MPNLDRTMHKVAVFLRQCVGEIIEGPSGAVSFPFGSTRLFVSGSEDPVDATTFVHIRAHIAHHVPITDQLYQWLATASNDLLFGRVTLTSEPGLPDHGELNLQHTLLGDFLDLEEIRTVVAFLALRADQLDDVVVEQLGGQRYEDLGPAQP